VSARRNSSCHSGSRSKRLTSEPPQSVSSSVVFCGNSCNSADSVTEAQRVMLLFFVIFVFVLWFYFVLRGRRPTLPLAFSGQDTSVSLIEPLKCVRDAAVLCGISCSFAVVAAGVRVTLPR